MGEENKPNPFFRREIPRLAGILFGMNSGNPGPKLTVVVLGSGTSQGVPMIGCHCPVCLSTDPRDQRTRASIYLETPEVKILVDTSPELRLQAVREGIDQVDAVLFTHPHADHLMGLDDLRRFCELGGMVLPIYGSPTTLAQIERTFPYAFNPNQVIKTYVRLKANVIEGPFTLGGLEVTPLPVPHGATATLGFLFGQNGRKLLAYLSDCSAVPEEVRAIVAGVEVLVIDGLRDKPHPAHLTVQAAVEVARGIGAARSFITHLTHEKSHVDREKDLPTGMGVAFDGMRLEFALVP